MNNNQEHLPMVGVNSHFFVEVKKKINIFSHTNDVKVTV